MQHLLDAHQGGHVYVILAQLEVKFLGKEQKQHSAWAGNNFGVAAKPESLLSP